jgi:hypothetical protein
MADANRGGYEKAIASGSFVAPMRFFTLLASLAPKRRKQGCRSSAASQLHAATFYDSKVIMNCPDRICAAISRT